MNGRLRLSLRARLLTALLAVTTVFLIVLGVVAATRAGLGVAIFARTLIPDGLVELPASAALPDVGEIDLVRHFVNLSKRNMAIDTNFYPLGSCTMKYNPKRHERMAALPGMANLHPLQSDESCQGMLELLFAMQSILAEIAGFFAAHREAGTWPGGVHVELTSDDVTECLGGGHEILDDHLGLRYETMCDPRLTRRQSLDLAFRVSELLQAWT